MRLGFPCGPASHRDAGLPIPMPPATAITLSTDRLAIPANGIAFGREPLQLSAGKPDKGVCFEYF